MSGPPFLLAGHACASRQITLRIICAPHHAQWPPLIAQRRPLCRAFSVRSVLLRSLPCGRGGSGWPRAKSRHFFASGGRGGPERPSCRLGWTRLLPRCRRLVPLAVVGVPAPVGSLARLRHEARLRGPDDADGLVRQPFGVVPLPALTSRRVAPLVRLRCRPPIPTIFLLSIPAQGPDSIASYGHNRFISFGISAAVNSWLQVNGLTNCRVVKAKNSPAALWITGMKSLHAAVQPPSMLMLAPVIWEAASLHRNRAAAATCSTVTNCRVG